MRVAGAGVLGLAGCLQDETDEQISNERGTYTLTDAEEVAEDSVVGFMRSPPHRETLLDSRFDRTGVGVALNKDGTVYATQNFCGQSS